jgi:hypothetical protein
MAENANRPHPSNSAVQREAEAVIVSALEKRFRCSLREKPPVASRLRPDGFRGGDSPICVEVFARQGKCKPGQQRKVMSDMCKLLLLEELLGVPCRKLVAVCDPDAAAFLRSSWRLQFVQAFGFEVIEVDIPDELRRRIRIAQGEQKST